MARVSCVRALAAPYIYNLHVQILYIVVLALALLMAMYVCAYADALAIHVATFPKARPVRMYSRIHIHVLYCVWSSLQ